MAAPFQARFDLLNKEDWIACWMNSDSKNTHKKVFADFCAAIDIDQECLADVDLQAIDGLLEILSKFYADQCEKTFR